MEKLDICNILLEGKLDLQSLTLPYQLVRQVLKAKLW